MMASKNALNYSRTEKKPEFDLEDLNQEKIIISFQLRGIFPKPKPISPNRGAGFYPSFNITRRADREPSKNKGSKNSQDYVNF